jgi:hypothetical protein
MFSRFALDLKARSTRAQVSRPALERIEEQRVDYMSHIMSTYSAEQLVFVDEAACNRFTVRRRFAWARVCDRARRHDYFVRGIRCVC